MRVPVVDLFAGPGGLGEGFSACRDDRVSFKVRLSIEKDAAAHRTLTLRSFYRQFRPDDVPDDYYSYVRGEIPRCKLFHSHLRQAFWAESHSLLAELGVTSPRLIDNRILEAIQGSKEWVLIGGPPCQAYSVVGRSRLTNRDRHEFESDERHYLYREYLRIIAKFRPAVFVMENVKGLLSAKLKGQSVFERILDDLSHPDAAQRGIWKHSNRKGSAECEYRIYSLTEQRDDSQPKDFTVKSELFGIPQRRHRVILFGVRCDLQPPDGLPLRPRSSVTVGDVLSDLPKLRSQLSNEPDSLDNWLCALRCGWSNLPLHQIEEDVSREIRHQLTLIGSNRQSADLCSSTYEEAKKDTRLLKDWFHDERLGAVCNHESRKHMREDLVRYLFISCFGRVKHRSPKLHQFPQFLLPSHQNVLRAVESRHGHFNDRFRVQVEHEAGTTVTSHIAKDGHSFIHHDPTQCRSWTVREAARVQTFPDNYFFEGFRTDQYRQVGNAVPPLLALQIADKVASVLRPLSRNKRTRDS